MASTPNSTAPLMPPQAPPLSVGTRLAYGVGQLADGIRVSGMGLYLFFYYVQVLGLRPSSAGPPSSSRSCSMR